MAQRPNEGLVVARPRRAMAVLVAAVVFAVAGCGASSSGVKATDTTVSEKATTTVEEATTTVDDTTTTEAPTTTEEKSTTTSKSDDDGWPEAAKDSFMKSCTSGSAEMKPTCECVLRGIEPVVSVADLMDVGTSGSLPDDMQSLIEDYAQKCAIDPDAY